MRLNQEHSSEHVGPENPDSPGRGVRDVQLALVIHFEAFLRPGHGVRDVELCTMSNPENFQQKFESTGTVRGHKWRGRQASAGGPEGQSASESACVAGQCEFDTDLHAFEFS